MTVLDGRNFGKNARKILRSISRHSRHRNLPKLRQICKNSIKVSQMKTKSANAEDSKNFALKLDFFFALQKNKNCFPDLQLNNKTQAE